MVELSPFLFADFLKDVAQYCKCVKSKIFGCSFLYCWSAFIILSMKAFVPLLGMHKERDQCRLIHTWGAIIGLFWLFFLVFFLASLVFCDLHVAFCSSLVFEEHQFKQHQWIVIYWFITINMLLLKCLACSSSVIFGCLRRLTVCLLFDQVVR